MLVFAASARVGGDTTVIPKVPEGAAGEIGVARVGGMKTGDVKGKSGVKEKTEVKDKVVVKGKSEARVKRDSATVSKTTSTVTGKAKTSTTTKGSTTSKTSTATKNLSSIKTSKTKSTVPSKTFTSTTKTTTAKSKKLKKGIGIELYQPLTFKYAILLDVPVEKVTDEKLLEVLDHWYGTRYRFGGENRRGIDCSAFTQAFMWSYLDHRLPRVAAEQYNSCKKIKKKKLRQGDLVFFKTHGPKGGISHVGVYLFNDRFVHSASSTGVRISNLNDDYYMEKYAGAGRIRWSKGNKVSYGV